MEKTTKLGALVNKAKGEDRSLREYARASHVDASVISKIINGSYVPLKNDVYELLTSEEAEPRGGVTYEMLIEAKDPSKSYKAGMEAGKALAGGALVAGYSGVTAALMAGSATAIPIFAPAGAIMFGLSIKLGESIAELGNVIKDKRIKKKAEQNSLRVQRFINDSKLMIMEKLGENGTSYRIEKGIDWVYSVDKIDVRLTLIDTDVSEYILRFVYLSEEESQNEHLIKALASKMIGDLFFIPNDNTRKVSFVTNSKELADYYREYEGKMSCGFELSVITVDSEKSLITEEITLSFCNGIDATVDSVSIK